MGKAAEMGSRSQQSSEMSDTHFGRFGGIFVPETIMAPLLEVAEAYDSARPDPQFQSELQALLRDYVGRPTPVYFCRRLTESFCHRIQ